jgi:chemotaxis response regulator CheB
MRHASKKKPVVSSKPIVRYFTAEERMKMARETDQQRRLVKAAASFFPETITLDEEHDMRYLKGCDYFDFEDPLEG